MKFLFKLFKRKPKRGTDEMSARWVMEIKTLNTAYESGDISEQVFWARRKEMHRRHDAELENALGNKSKR